MEDALIIAALGSGPLRLQVRGGCMRPVLRDGDWVEIERIHGPLVRGEIVVARDASDALVCHRVLAVEPLVLSGDRGRPHLASKALGRVVRSESGGPWVARSPRSIGARVRSLANNLVFGDRRRNQSDYRETGAGATPAWE